MLRVHFTTEDLARTVVSAGVDPLWEVLLSGHRLHSRHRPPQLRPWLRALAAWDCELGYICFWDGFGGQGSRCAWSGNDSNWLKADGVCSWSDDRPVKSVYNRGQSTNFTGVVYYHNTGYNDRIGCTKRGKKGDLAGTYSPLSHQWTTGSCG